MNRVLTYRTSDRLNYSTLKLLWDDPYLVKWKKENPDSEDEESAAYRIGGAIDCVLTTPDKFQEEFWISNNARPWGLMGIFIDNLPDSITEESPTSDYEAAYKAAGYKIAIETVIKQLWGVDKYRDFLLAKQAALGKTVLSSDEYDIVKTACDALLANPTSREYFISKDSSRYELFHQVPIYFEHKGVRCKALLDGLIVDRLDKTVKLFDLKSIGRKIGYFPHSFLYYKYYLQAAFYQIALKALVEGNATSPVNIPHIRGYDLLNPEYVTVHKNPKFAQIRLFEVSGNDLESGINGNISLKGDYYPGVEELLDDYKWHVDNDFWNTPRRIAENENRDILDVFRSTSFYVSPEEG